MRRRPRTSPVNSPVDRLNDIQQQQAKLKIEQDLLLDKAMKSNDPDTILKASVFWSQLNKDHFSEKKSYLFDPYNLRESLGYKDKVLTVSYDTLRSMTGAPIIKAIIRTRTEQVASFSEYSQDEQKFGWQIRKKKTLFQDKINITDEDKKNIEFLANFINNGGIIDEKQDSPYGGNWNSENFDVFLRKFTIDSLSLDQATFEVVRNQVRKPVEFFATDGSTYRIAESITEYNKTYKREYFGYYPKYVQIYSGQIVNEFFPWELCFGIRNPSTDIRVNGYGRSEMEDLIKVVTWMLYGDSYNGKFFSQGAAPKGILKLQGNVNDARLAEFKQQWIAQVAGVNNAWKTPVLEADKMEWIDLQKTNQDMQFGQWQEYLIKLTCAIYTIDPSEIGFPMGGSSSNIFEADREYKLEFSQEKGLKPLLKFIQRKINQYIITPLNDDYEFIFTGLNLDNETKQLDNDIKKLSNFMGYKELRKKYNLPENIAKDDLILNGIWYQAQVQAQQGNQQSNQAVNTDMWGGGGEEQEAANPYSDYDQNNPFGDVNSKEGEDNPFGGEHPENPFMKSFNNYIDQLIHEGK